MHPDLVYHVQHIVKVGGGWGHAVTDLVFVDKQPIAVLEWAGEPGKELPLVFVKLDSAHLQEFRSGYVTHLYDIPIEDPRVEPQTPYQAPDHTQ